MSVKPKGKAKEVYGASIDGEAKKEEGRALRKKAEALEESEQREKTVQAKVEAKQVKKEHDRQRLKGEGVLDSLMGKGGWTVSPITSPAASGRR